MNRQIKNLLKLKDQGLSSEKFTEILELLYDKIMEQTKLGYFSMVDGLIATHYAMSMEVINKNPERQYFIDKDLLDWLIKPIYAATRNNMNSLNDVYLFVTNWNKNHNILMCNFKNVWVNVAQVPLTIPTGHYSYAYDSIVCTDPDAESNVDFRENVENGLKTLGMFYVPQTHIGLTDEQYVSFEFTSKHSKTLTTVPRRNDSYFSMKQIQQILSIQDRRVSNNPYKMKWHVNSKFTNLYFEYSRGFSLLTGYTNAG